MQFKIANKDVEPSQEDFIGLAIIAISLIFYITAAQCITKLKDWRESKKSPDERLLDLLKKMQEKDYLTPGCMDYFPSNYGMTIEECKKDGDGYFAPDPDKKDPVLVVDAVSMKEFLKWVGKLTALVNALASMNDTDNCVRKIDSVVKSNFTKSDFVYDENNKPKEIVLQKVKAKWPTFEFYDNPPKCIRTLEESLGKIRQSYKKIADNVKQIIKESTDNASEEELQNRVCYVETARTVTMIHGQIVDKFKDNFYDLVKIDVVYYDEYGYGKL